MSIRCICLEGVAGLGGAEYLFLKDGRFLYHKDLSMRDRDMVDATIGCATGYECIILRRGIL